MGRRSQFSAEQEVHIASFFSDLERTWELNASAVAKWKEEKANEIIKSPVFLDKLPSKAQDADRGASPLLRIKTKFRNHLTGYQTKRGTGSTGQSRSNATGTSKASGDDGLTSSKSFLVRPTLTARRLFEIERKEAILALAKTKAESVQAKRVIECYQVSKKELWEQLGKATQDEFGTRAAALKNDIGINQAGFASAIWSDLNDFVKSGLFGEMTITMMWSCRTVKDSLIRGHASAHSSGDQEYFDESGSEWEGVWNLWKAYAEKTLPPRVPVYNVECKIPLDTDGTPLFPELDVDEMAPAKIVSVVKQFIAQLYAHCRPSDGFSWSAAADCYDKARFQLPVDMELIESVGGAKAIMLAEFFMNHREEERFVFLPADEGEGGEDGGAEEDDVDVDGEENGKQKKKKGKASSKKNGAGGGGGSVGGKGAKNDGGGGGGGGEGDKNDGGEGGGKGGGGEGDKNDGGGGGGGGEGDKNDGGEGGGKGGGGEGDKNDGGGGGGGGEGDKNNGGEGGGKGGGGEGDKNDGGGRGGGGEGDKNNGGEGGGKGGGGEGDKNDGGGKGGGGEGDKNDGGGEYKGKKAAKKPKAAKTANAKASKKRGRPPKASDNDEDGERPAKKARVEPGGARAEERPVRVKRPPAKVPTAVGGSAGKKKPGFFYVDANGKEISS
ncbi:hypothetical protein B0H19DRAFT_1260299 [Mycena capillaripes]|nr:hypothetical protein B0H19DRAFT_1260299 [Mycena capillaripes]